MNIKKFLIGASAAAILLASAVPAFAVGTNGSFETGVAVPFGGATTVNSPDSVSITDWNVATGDVDYVNGFWQAADGTRSIDLNGFGPGSVSQTLTTVVGGTYNVTFAMSGNPGNCEQFPNGICSPSNKVLRVSATGTASQDFSYDTSSKGNTFADMMWENHIYSFIATGTSTTLTFASQIDGAFGPALDNVVIEEILPTPTPTVSIGKATGGIRLSNPKQQISFEAFDNGISSADKGHVEYQNFEYPGGLHYTANVLCANVDQINHKAWFMFQIPTGFPGLSGLYVVSYVNDGGTPGTNGDIYGHTASSDLTTATGWCENGNATVGFYPVTGGNLVVHK